MAAAKTFTITPTYDLLLRGSPTVPYGLYQLQVLTAEQLTRLHYRPGMITTVKTRLKRLTDHGYLQADAMPARYEGGKRIVYASPYYYTLGPKGIRYLREAGYAVSESWRPSKETEKSLLFLAHTLEINDIMISAALTRQLERMTHERVLKRKPFTYSYQQVNYSLIPDGFLRFAAGEKPRRFLLEHDRAREPNADIRKKIRAYRALLRSEPFPILFTTFEGEAHRDRLRQWVRAELVKAKEPPEVGRYFYFAALTRPPGPDVWTASVWYTPYSEPPSALLS